MSDNNETYPEDLNYISVIDMDSSATIQVDRSEFQGMQAASTLQNQQWIIQILDQVGADSSAFMTADSAVDQQPLLDPADQPGSMMAGSAVDQPAEGGAQPSASFQTSREEAIPGTSGRRGQKRKRTDEEEGNKKLRQYMRDLNDPSLTPKEIASIKNAINAKRNRDKKNEEQHQLTEELDHATQEINQLKEEIEELRATIIAQGQQLLQYQARDEAVRKLVTSPLDSGMFQ